MSKHIILKIMLLSVFVIRTVHAESPELTPITVQLKWKHQFQFAGFYAAVEKGFYRNAGFDVTLKERTAGVDPIHEVVEGRADYGVADAQLVYYRMQGVPVTVLAVLIQHSPNVIISLRESNIHTPQDLIGKRVMFADGAYGAGTLSLLVKEGVQRSQIEHMPSTHNIQDLIDGKVDAMSGYVTSQPYKLRKLNLPVNIIYPRHYGVDFYGDNLFTSDSNVRANFDEVRRFREATLQGWRYAVKNPDEIIELIRTKYQPQMPLDELQFEARETIRLIVPELVEIGHMNPGRWEYMAETFAGLGMAPANYNLEGFLFDPTPEDLQEPLRKTLWGLAVVCALGVGGILFLGYFNRRLRRAVDTKTAQLVKANEALFKHTQNLVEKERALFKLNHELEQRVEERTRALAKANTELHREIDERKQRELSLRLLSNAVESSRSGILVTDAVGVVVYVNAAFAGMIGLPLERICHKHVSALKPKVVLPDFSLNVLGRNPQSVVRSEVECLGTDNQRLWVQVSISPICDDTDQPTHYVIACEDITLLKQSKDDMERLAYYDSLTGLENRVLFKLRLDKAIASAQREKIKTALMFIDVDHFKLINDNFGHDAGDEVLKAVSSRIKQNVRNNDTVARISGDEFTVLLSGVHSNDDVRKVAQGILKTLSRPIKLNGNEYFVSASIGISITPDDGVLIDELMKNADMAMYEAKRLGRNNFQFFSKRLNDEAKRNLDLEQELKAALADQTFFIAYQPRVCLETMRLTGVEALLRWRHPELGTMYPDYFITFAEESGLIVELGRWVLAECAKSAQILVEAGFDDILLSVNVSGRQIRDRGLVEDIRGIFGRQGDRIRNIELEITETSLIDNHNDCIQTVQELKALGFTLSIDDFGTGYSSLSYLKRLPIDYVKIDKSFVHDIPHDLNNVEIVRAVIAMAHNLKLKVVAEGVETAEQLQFLKDCGCDYAQGYYFGKGMPLRDLIKRFKSWHPTIVQA